MPVRFMELAGLQCAHRTTAYPLLWVPPPCEHLHSHLGLELSIPCIDFELTYLFQL